MLKTCYSSFSITVSILIRSIRALKSLGSVEEEIGDSAAKSAKIRPMRVEMHLCFHTCEVFKTSQVWKHKCIAADSGETTNLEMILAVRLRVILSNFISFRQLCLFRIIYNIRQCCTSGNG